MTRFWLCVLCVLSISSTTLWAQIKSDKPADVCKYLEKHSLQVAKYSRIGAGMYFGTIEKNLTEKDPPSKISFTLEGEVEDKVQSCTLLIAVEGPADAQDAQAQLISCAKSLIPKAAGAEAPAELIEAIKNQKDGKWKLGEYTVRVDCWKSETSKRYTIGIQVY